MIKKEVQPPEPEQIPTPPWFTVSVDVSVASVLAVLIGVPVTLTILTVGNPDLLDAIVAWVSR